MRRGAHSAHFPALPRTFAGDPVPGVEPKITLHNTTFANEVVEGGADELTWCVQ